MKGMLLFLAGSAMFTIVSYAPLTPDDNTNKLSFFAMQVSNVEVMTEWYAKNFDLQIDQKMDDQQNGYKVSILKNKTMTVELVQMRQNAHLKPGSDTPALGFFKVGFEVANVDQLLARLSKNKIDIFGRVYSDAKTRKRNFLIKDPEGNLVQFFER